VPGKSLALLAAATAATVAGSSATGATKEAPLVAPIVYAAGGTGAARSGSELYVREAGGTRTRRLTSNRVFDGFPRWSPDHTKIAFVRANGNDSDVYVMDGDGTQVRRLAGSARRAQDLYPTWSPNGKLIAFASNRFGENEIMVMRADGTGVRRVTRTPRWIDDLQPVFTPDGKALVIASNRIAFSNYELFRIRLSDGKVLKRLTRWGANGDLTPGDDLMPSFSRDGKRIVWVSDRPGVEQRVEYAIWTMNANGGEVRRVVRHPGLNVAFPRFAPDDRTILYSSFVFPPEAAPRDYEVRGYLPSDGAYAWFANGTEADW
jgi:TolB protein